METKKIFTINNVDIVVTNDGLVPVKPICEALGVAYERQFSKLKEDEDFSSIITLRVMVGADGKDREMCCLPVRFVYGWLYTINPKNVKPESQQAVRAYRRQCVDALYNHFNGQQERRNEQDELERSLLAQLDMLDEREKGAKNILNATKVDRANIERRLKQVRQERITNEPTLFN